MRNVWTIASREFRLYFASPVAYTVAAVVLLILGGIFSINIYIGLVNGQITPDGRMVVGPLVTILIFATPALTMRVLADEHRQGTIELLLTAPVRDWEVVVGKWLGATAFLWCLVGVTWIYPLILHRMTTPGIDQGVLVAAYLGVAAMTMAMVAIGVLVSSFFSSSVAAFFATLGLLLGLWIIGGFASTATGAGSEVIRYLSFVDHYYTHFYRGVLDMTDAVYFLSLAVLALFLASQVVEARRWR